jgi:hypothetical protein
MQALQAFTSGQSPDCSAGGDFKTKLIAQRRVFISSFNLLSAQRSPFTSPSIALSEAAKLFD